MEHCTKLPMITQNANITHLNALFFWNASKCGGNPIKVASERKFLITAFRRGSSKAADTSECAFFSNCVPSETFLVLGRGFSHHCFGKRKIFHVNCFRTNSIASIKIQIQTWFRNSSDLRIIWKIGYISTRKYLWTSSKRFIESRNGEFRQFWRFFLHKSQKEFVFLNRMQVNFKKWGFCY